MSSWQYVLPSARGERENKTCQMVLFGHLMKSCQMVRVARLSEALVRSCATGSAPARELLFASTGGDIQICGPFEPDSCRLTVHPVVGSLFVF